MSSKNKMSAIKRLKSECNMSEQIPFAEFLDSNATKNLVSEHIEAYRERVFTPLLTLSAFVQQTMNPDQSCSQVVSKIIAQRVASKKKKNSTDTGPYCKARQRLPELLMRSLARATGENLNEQTLDIWKWKGRVVKLVDGTTVSMPDTWKNQLEYPQPDSQERGLGFPIARCVGVISLATGALLDIAVGPYHRKETGEHALLREILDCFSPGDIFLGDRYYCSYFLIAMLLEMKVDAAFQIHARRKFDFRRGTSLGKKDHLVDWVKPTRPSWMDNEMYEKMPETLTVRETKVGKKVIVTTFLDPEEISKKDIGDLYSRRWSVEVDLRSIKEVMEMDILRCKTPGMVRKEIYAHMVAYNLIRTVMAQTADSSGKNPRKISFKGALQQLNNFRLHYFYANKRLKHKIYTEMLHAIASSDVGNRPGRSEPRVKKRRPKAYPRMTTPRRKIS